MGPIHRKLSPYDVPAMPVIRLVNPHWTHSITSTSSHTLEDQTCTQYFRCRHTRALYCLSKLSSNLYSNPLTLKANTLPPNSLLFLMLTFRQEHLKPLTRVFQLFFLM